MEVNGGLCGIEEGVLLFLQGQPKSVDAPGSKVGSVPGGRSGRLGEQHRTLQRCRGLH